MSDRRPGEAALPILLRCDDVYCWTARQPGRTLISATKGSLVVMPGWLAFGTDGKNGVLGGVLIALASSVPGVTGVAISASDLGRTVLSRRRASKAPLDRPVPYGEGSWAAPFPLVTECEAIRRRFMSYLRVTLQAPGHPPQGFSLKNQSTFRDAQLFADLVNEGRGEERS